MPTFGYIARSSIKSGHIWGSSYVIHCLLKDYDDKIKRIGELHQAMDGSGDPVIQRRDLMINITTDGMTGTQLAEFREMLDSALDGQEITYDFNGTLDSNGNPVRVNPIQCVLDDDDVKPKPWKKPGYFYFDFVLRTVAEPDFAPDYHHDLDLTRLINADIGLQPQILPGFVYSRVDSGITFAMRTNGLYEPIASNVLTSHYDHINQREMGPWFGPAETNLLLQSCNLMNASWTVSAATRAAAANKLFNHASATPTRLTNIATSGQLYQTVGTTNGNPELVSAVVEKASNNMALLRVEQNSTLLTQYSFDLTTGVATLAGGTAGAAGAIKLLNVGPNGGAVWYVWMQSAASTSGQTRRIACYGDYTISSGDVIYHGLQLVNNASVAQPIILTTTAAAARGADLLQHNGLPSWIQFDQYSLGAVFDIWQTSTGSRYLLSLQDASAGANSALVAMMNTATVYSRTYSGSVSQAALGAVITAGRQRVVGRHKLNDFRSRVNGSDNSDSAGVMPVAPDRMYIGSAGGSNAKAFISRAMFRPGAMSNAELTAW